MNGSRALVVRVATMLPYLGLFATVWWILMIIPGGVGAVAQSVDPQALQRMAASERAFAAATAEIGVRDGFLTFFAPDAVTVRPGADGSRATVEPAREGLIAQALNKLPLAARLLWEPYTGHVSSDGSLGWLTGAYVVQDAALKNVLGKGAYFSVWKRQADGTWRVWLDEGISLPDIWQNASPFRVAPEPDAGVAGSADETLETAERSIAQGGAAWAARWSADVRVHRDGRMPIIGREAATTWTNTAWSQVSFFARRTEAAVSGDLGVVIGGYDATTEGRAEHGTWVRVWKRDVTGRWRIVFETNKPAR